MRAWLVGLLASGLILGASAVSMARGGAYETAAPYTWTVTGCGGQAVTVSGWMRNVMHIFTDGSGAYHLQDAMSFDHAFGIDRTTGATYVFTGGSHFVQMSSVLNAANEATAPFQWNLIGQGSAPNLVMHAVLHYTVNAQGVLTTEVMDMSTTCTG